MSDRRFPPTRQTLLERLRNWDDGESWREFFDRYWKLIYSVARQNGLEDAEAQDVVQETVLSVAKQMPSFRYDRASGTFKSWLMLITRRRITDHLRRQQRQPAAQASGRDSTTGTATLDRIPDSQRPSLSEIWETEWQKNLMASALTHLKKQVEARHFQIFDCYVLKEWPVADVMKTFGVGRNQVYLIKHRLSNLLRQEVKRLTRDQTL